MSKLSNCSEESGRLVQHFAAYGDYSGVTLKKYWRNMYVANVSK